MDTLDAIFSRHSISKVKPNSIPHALIEQLLSAAVQAPNHFRVRPWRFFVLTGDARVRLGSVMAEALQKRHPESSPGELAKEQAKPLRAPVLIVVAVDKPAEPKVVEIENISAASAAVENLLLAANALGLGAMWRTGLAASYAEVKSFFGLEPDQYLIAFVYIGYPDLAVEFPPRPSFEDRTTWMDA